MGRPAWWLELPIRGKIAATVGLAAILPSAAAWVVTALESRAAVEEESARREMEIASLLERLETAQGAASAQIRGYFLTGDEEFVTRGRKAVRMFEDGWRALFALLPGTTVRLTQAQHIATLEASREERIYGTVARFRAHAVSAAELRLELGRAEQERQAIEARLEQMEADEKRLADGHRARGDRLRSDARTVVWSGALLLVGLAATAWEGMVVPWMAGFERLRRQGAHLASISKMEPAIGGGGELDGLRETIAKAAEVLDERTRVLDHALHGIARIDAAGHCLCYNQAFGEMSGLSQSGEQMNLLACVHGDDWEKVEDARDAAWRGARGEVGVRLVQQDGRQIDVLMSFLRAGEDFSRGQYVFVRDNRHQKRREAELIHAREAAIQSSAAKTRFLAKITHDIRTPLNAVLGASTLLAQTEMTNEQREYVSLFERNSQRLTALINDFLDFAKIEAGAVRVERAPFRVRQTTGDVVRTFRDAALRKGVTLEMAIAPEVPECQIGDALRVQQVLMNLVSNAVKFTIAGRIDVRARVCNGKNGKQLRFQVADTGPGIQPCDREKIFAAFTQLPAAGSERDGAGLGLTICRELTQLMDGEIGIEPDAGPGATFYFAIPLAASELPEVTATVFSPDPPDSIGDRRIRILAAEDAADSRFLLERYLRDEAISLRVVEDGQEAVEVVESGEEFDVILMDIDMPRMDGRAATRKIREWQAQAGVRPTPIVALSAFAVQTEVWASLEAGCVAHIVKPVDPGKLIGIIRRCAWEGQPAVADAEDAASQKKVAELVPSYLAAQAKRIGEATVQLTTRDFDPIRRFGHNLKGTGRGYGFPEIEELGRAIEGLAAQADERRLAEQLLALQRVVNAASRPFASAGLYD